MAYALTNDFGPAVAFPRRTYLADDSPDDSLDSMRGIIACTLMSVLVFWLPLAFALTR
jgi:hypothetical protein